MTESTIIFQNDAGYGLRIDSYIMDLDNDNVAVSTKASVIKGGLDMVDFGYLSKSFTADIDQKKLLDFQKVQQERLVKLMGDFWGDFSK